MFTNCVSPPELEDKLLLAYLDDRESNQEIARHLEKCSYCRERATALDRLQKRMTSQLYRITCPPSIELGEYQLRLLSPSQMLLISQHLRECPHCTKEVDQLKGFLGDLTSGVEDNFFRQAKVLIARLVSGREGASLAGEPSFALRGQSEGPLTFEVEGIVIVLDIQPANEGMVSILGQVAADDQDQWTGATVKLEQANGFQTTEVLDDLGAFRFEEALSGPVQITIVSLHGVEIQIQDLIINF